MTVPCVRAAGPVRPDAGRMGGLPVVPRPKVPARAGLQVRALRPGAADAALVERLVLSAGPAALRARFFLPVEPDPAELLARYGHHLLPAASNAITWIALLDTRPVGLLHLVPFEPLLVEAAVLVAVDMQRRGIGSALIRASLADPRWAGWTVRATVQHSNHAARALLRATAPEGRARWAGDCLDFDIPIPPQVHSPTPGGARRPDLAREVALWWVVDRTGRAVSVGFAHRAEAAAVLRSITEALRSEMQQLGHGPRAIARRLNGYGLGQGPPGACFRPPARPTRAEAHDRRTIPTGE
jgi:GNAT superfamily N-acetyltransferase